MTLVNRHNKAANGFTMIEAIVAIAVIGMATIPITMLIGQTIDQLTRVAEANARASAIESALAVIDPINPMDTPTGEIDMGEITILWNSDVLVPPNSTIQIGAGLAGQSIGFYDVQVEMQREGLTWFTFSLRKVGFQRLGIDIQELGIN